MIAIKDRYTSKFDIIKLKISNSFIGSKKIAILDFSFGFD